MSLDRVVLKDKVASFIKKDPDFASKASEEIFNQILDEIVLGMGMNFYTTEMISFLRR